MFKSSSKLCSLVLLTAALFSSGVSAQGRVDSISSSVSSKCLQVRDSKLASGTAVESYECNASTSQWQQWKISPGSTTVVVASPCPGAKLCLDAGNAPVSTSKVVINECNNSASQQWTFTAGGPLKLANANLCLDVPNSSSDAGLQVQVYTCHGGLNQAWKLV